ncbi:carbohydrate sulfotransferase 3-like [Mytilus trossulus]|uniref:carbohydrate sulfotransferase 3-like n=1 Tax=Mytilus trossulus TaxID=6551 RepID=UPI003003B718
MENATEINVQNQVTTGRYCASYNMMRNLVTRLFRLKVVPIMVFVGILVLGVTFNNEYKKTLQVVQDYLNSKMVRGIVTKVNNDTNMPFMSHQQLQNKDGVKNKIVIASYMRSGSTFTSELIQQGKNVFFVFEPFHGIYHQQYRRKDSVCTRDGACRFTLDKLESRNTTFEIFKNIFSCKMSFLPAEVLASFWKFESLTGRSRLNKCYKPKTLNNIRDLVKKRKCIRYLEDICNRSNTILIKTIRMSLDILFDIFSGIPHLKIVHLVRDPRAILNSRDVFFFEKNAPVDITSIKTSAYALCDRMYKDVITNKDYNQTKQGAFVLKYECLATDPMTVTKILYNYLNLDYTDSVPNWLQRHTRGNKTEEGKVGAQKGNSLSISTKWITRFSQNVSKLIDKECKILYKSLGITDSQSMLQQYRKNKPKLYEEMCRDYRIQLNQRRLI